jgi:hypothetical protein
MLKEGTMLEGKHRTAQAMPSSLSEVANLPSRPSLNLFGYTIRKVPQRDETWWVYLSMRKHFIKSSMSSSCNGAYFEGWVKVLGSHL